MRKKQLISKLLLLGMCTSICAGITTTMPVVNSYADTAVTYVANSGWNDNKVIINDVTFLKTGVNAAAIADIADSLTQLTIPEKITVNGHDFTVDTIKENACGSSTEGQKKLREVTIPATITKIGNWTFAGDLFLETVNFDPNIQLKEIPTGMFAVCTSLKNITIPNTVERIRGFAFNSCASLGVIKLPYNLDSIDSYAFVKADEDDAPLEVIVGGKISNIGVSSFATRNDNIKILVKGIPTKTPGGSNLTDTAGLIGKGSGVESTGYTSDKCKIKIKPVLSESEYYAANNDAFDQNDDDVVYHSDNAANCDVTKYEGELIPAYEFNYNFASDLIESYSIRHGLWIEE